jgi:histidine triad (HIT) family protein
VAIRGSYSVPAGSREAPIWRVRTRSIVGDGIRSALFASVNDEVSMPATPHAPRPSGSRECTICDLIRGSAEVSLCHEDADSIAFMDIQPVNSGHVLVVPRAHYESLLDVPQEIGMHLFRVTMRLAAAVRRVTGCDDMNIVVNSGAAAGQDEPHYHVHIIPRRPEDGFDIPLPFAGSAMPDRTLLDAMAVQILAALRDPMRREGGGEHGTPSRRGTDSWRGAAPGEERVVNLEALGEGAHGEMLRAD